MSVLSKGNVRVGIFGSSAITKKHLNALLNIKPFDLVGIFGTYKPALAEYQKTYGLNVYEDAAELAQNIDLAVITTRADKHLSLLEKIIPHCQKIVCEKPLVLNQDELVQLSDVKEKYDAQIFTVVQKRYDPSLRRVQEALLRGGNLKINIRKHRPPEYYETGENNSKAPIYSQMPHFIDLSQILMRDNLKLLDAKAGRPQSGPFPDELSLMLETSAGRKCEIMISMDGDKNYPVSFEIGKRKILMPRKKNIWSKILRTRRPNLFECMYKDLAAHISDKSWWESDWLAACSTVKLTDEYAKRTDFLR